MLSELEMSELVELRRENAEFRRDNAELRHLVAELQATIEKLSGIGGDSTDGSGSAPAKKTPPSWVKANRPERTKTERKPREKSFVRHTETATNTVVHSLKFCPKCNHEMPEGTDVRVRQVMDIPVTPVQTTNHVYKRQCCGYCKAQYVAPADPSVSVGKNRFGVNLMSLIGWLRFDSRLPIEGIQSLLRAHYKLKISVGEIVRICGVLANRSKSMYETLLGEIRSSSYVHADETGWREDGVNGYLWSFSTPNTRLFIRGTRSRVTPEAVLGDYDGILCTDFYGAYNFHLGLHQRCWVHYLRDLNTLAEKFELDQSVVDWIRKIKDIYHRAKEFNSTNRKARIKARERFQDELMEVGLAFDHVDSPQRVLAARATRYASELFTFVEFPEVPSENNPAERAIRPAVIARKISGGTRSERGSEVRTVMMSIFATWKVRGVDALQACRELLMRPIAPTPTHA